MLRLLRLSIPVAIISAVLYGLIILWTSLALAQTETPTSTVTKTRTPSGTPTQTPTASPTTAGCGQDRFWVGGSGDTSDSAHWSCTTGGPGGAPLPDSTTNCLFDQNSFSAGGQTVCNQGVTCKDFTWTNATNAPTLSASGLCVADIFVYGNFTLIVGMTVDSSLFVAFPALSGSFTVDSAGHTLSGVNFKGSNVCDSAPPVPQWSLVSDLTVGATAFLNSGMFNLNGHRLTTEGFDMACAGSDGVSPGTETLAGTGAIHIITAGGTQIFLHEGGLVNACAPIIFEDSLGGSGQFSTNGDFLNPPTTVYLAACFETGANIRILPTFDALNLPPQAPQQINHLSIEPGATVWVDDLLTDTNITQLDCTGTVLSPLTITGTSGGGGPYGLIVTNTVACDYATITSSRCTSNGGSCYAGTHSVDGGFNAGWVFTDPPAATPGPVISCDTIPSPVCDTPTPTPTATSMDTPTGTVTSTPTPKHCKTFTPTPTPTGSPIVAHQMPWFFE